jgi:hypothetical protein
MNPRLWIPCFALLAWCLAGCEGPVARDCSLSPVEKTFVLSEPYEFVDSAGAGAVCLLAPGVYRCYYMDPCGDYYEAPFTTKREYFFSGNRRGGVYVTRSEPRECSTYVQDNQITHYYGYAGGSSQYGGSGKFVILTRLTEDFLELAKFSQAQEGASRDENR